LFAEIAGVPQIVQFSRESVYGITPDTGKMLWSYSGSANGTANIATPTIFGDHVLSSSGYGKGSGLVKITNLSTDSQKADEIYYQPKLSNHHGGLIKVGDHVYGFGGALVCMNFLTGEIVWQNRSVGKGSVISADGMLYLLGENSEVGLAEATPEEYRESGRFKIDNFSRPAWAHPVVANGKLFLRNMHRLTAYDVQAK
jgi:outer membrane protein assembly factor BamB